MNVLLPHDWPNDWLDYIDTRLETAGNVLQGGQHIAQGTYPGLETEENY